MTRHDGAAPVSVAILCSGIALGTYVPAMLLARQLRSLHLDATVLVLEALFSRATSAKIRRHRDAFHGDFELAKLAHRMVRDAAPSLCATRLADLLGYWAQSNQTRFIVLSGFWRPILESYRHLVGRGHDIVVDCLHLDASESRSWRVGTPVNADEHHTWIFSHREGRVIQRFGGSVPSKSYAQRNDALVLHGGGWGMGTYRACAPELAVAGYALNVIAYKPRDLQSTTGSETTYLVDESWEPWMTHEATEFPRFDRVVGGTIPPCTNVHTSSSRHLVGDLVANSLGVVSKPGGGTLIDSMMYGAPVVLLEPLTDYEAANAQTWENLGFGVSLDTWRTYRHSRKQLRDAHRRLQSLVELPDYGESYAAAYDGSSR